MNEISEPYMSQISQRTDYFEPETIMSQPVQQISTPPPQRVMMTYR